MRLTMGQTWSGGGIDPVSVAFSYNARGERTGVHRYADLAGTQLVSSTSMQYDGLGRMTSLAHLDGTASEIDSYTYAYDLANRLTDETTQSGNDVFLTYDDVGQLIDAAHSTQPDESYQYDANGNRIGGDYLVGPNNQILSDGQFDYTYDNEGNLLTKTEIAIGNVTEYTYDHRNRLTRVQQRSSGGIILSEVEYVYDVLDRMIARTVDADGDGPQAGETMYTLYDGDNAWADFDASGNVVARYLFGQGIDDLLARHRPGEGTAWYLTDHLGSVRDIVDAAGTLNNHIQYDSFGNILLETNPTAGDRFKFTGREWNGQLGLYYYRARFYDPAAGRFISQDPLRFAARDTNLYRYVGNAPMAFVDPTGQVGVISETTAYHLSRIGVALASGFSGFVFGYTCGYLNAVTVQGLEGAEATFHAQRLGLLVGSIDFAATIVFGSRSFAGASLGTKIVSGGIFAGFAAALGTAASLVTGERASDNPAGKIIDGVCFAVSTVGGFSVGRALNGFVRTPRAGTLTNAERAQIQAIANKHNTTIDVVGSRAAGRGRNIDTNFPVGKDVPGGPPTRSDIDFRIDHTHPNVDDLIADLETVGNGAGNASVKHSTNPAGGVGRQTFPPFIRFSPSKNN